MEVPISQLTNWKQLFNLSFQCTQLERSSQWWNFLVSTLSVKFFSSLEDLLFLQHIVIKVTYFRFIGFSIFWVFVWSVDSYLHFITANSCRFCSCYQSNLISSLNPIQFFSAFISFIQLILVFFSVLQPSLGLLPIITYP